MNSETPALSRAQNARMPGAGQIHPEETSDIHPYRKHSGNPA